jgi:hypothetical protein
MLQLLPRIVAAALLAGCTLNRPLAPVSPAANPTSAPTQAQALPAAALFEAPSPTPLTALRPTPLTALSSVTSHVPPAAGTPLRRLLKREVSRAIAKHARRIIDAYAGEPFGTEIPFEVEGKTYVARFEEHYHEPGGQLRPWGPHPGVSVFVAKSGS